MASETVILPRNEHCVSRTLIDENSLKVLYRLRQHGYKAYLVGGSVRDLLLGRQPKDFDVGTDATPEQVRKLFRNCRLIGRRFRLAHILFGGDERIEVATFRRKAEAQELDAAAEASDSDGDSDGEGRRNHFAENVFGTPQQDAFRRDFTINALFYDIDDFSIIDHVGGLQDLRAGIIRVIGDAEERFAEDPVRMLRALEFAARLGFELDEAIPEAIAVSADRLLSAAPARIREEVLELFRHKVGGQVLQKCERYGLLPFLLPDFTARRSSFDLLRQLDMRTATGAAVSEPLVLATLYLDSFLDACNDAMTVGDVHKVANRILSPHCRTFSIANGIRHQAREMLIGFFRLSCGRGRRGEGRFIRHPATLEALELYRLWSEIHPEGRELLDSWQRLLRGEEPAAPAKKRRRPRKRRKPVASAGAGAAAVVTPGVDIPLTADGGATSD